MFIGSFCAQYYISYRVYTLLKIINQSINYFLFFNNLSEFVISSIYFCISSAAVYFMNDQRRRVLSFFSLS